MKMKKYLVMIMLLSAGLVLTGCATVQAPPELVAAIADGNVEKVKSIVEKNPKLVNSVDATGYTLLDNATHHTDYEMVKLLIDMGADINAKNRFGTTPLTKAAGWASKDENKVAYKTVELLIAKGANVNAKDGQGRAPLHVAAMSVPRDTVELLIKKGANVNARNKFGNTPIYCAMSSDYGWSDGKGGLIGKPNAKEIAMLLIENGADVKKVSKSGETLLHCAAQNRWYDLAEVLIKKGVKVNARYDGGNRYNFDAGFTALHYAVWGNYKEIVELLIANGADVNLRRKFVPNVAEAHDIVTGEPIDFAYPEGDDRAALDIAALFGRTEIAKILIASGADINAKTATGNTPLHMAARNGHKEIVELLIAKGAEVNAKDKHGKTPLDLAVKKKNNKEVIDLLKKHGAVE